jgi:hypothetical protein
MKVNEWERETYKQNENDTKSAVIEWRGLQDGKQPMNQAPTPARQANTHPTSTLHMINFISFFLFLFSLRSRRLGGRYSLRQF